MEVSELTIDEQRVLVGLVKMIVHADHEVSEEERTILKALQRRIGNSGWNALVRDAQGRFPTVEDLEAAARDIGRPGAQRCIHGVLTELAGSDRIIDAEEHVLRWVAQEWGLQQPAPLVELDEDGFEDLDEDEEDSAVETFVLLDDDD